MLMSSPPEVDKSGTAGFVLLYSVAADAPGCRVRRRVRPIHTDCCKGQPFPPGKKRIALGCCPSEFWEPMKGALYGTQSYGEQTYSLIKGKCYRYAFSFPPFWGIPFVPALSCLALAHCITRRVDTLCAPASPAAYLNKDKILCSE